VKTNHCNWWQKKNWIPILFTKKSCTESYGDSYGDSDTCIQPLKRLFDTGVETMLSTFFRLGESSPNRDKKPVISYQSWRHNFWVALRPLRNWNLISEWNISSSFFLFSFSFLFLGPKSPKWQMIPIRRQLIRKSINPQKGCQIHTLCFDINRPKLFFSDILNIIITSKLWEGLVASYINVK
jgi:hypothetical protein